MTSLKLSQLKSYALLPVFSFVFCGIIVGSSTLALAAPSADSNGANNTDPTALNNAINAKCNKADQYKGLKNTNYKDLQAACNATGKYKPNANQPAELAARLLSICGHKAILQNVKAYSKIGDTTGYTDCDKIKADESLKDLAALAYGKDQTDTNDPALDCVSDKNQGNNTDSKCDLVKKYVNPLISFLSAFVAIAVTIGIIVGGLRYVTAQDDPQKVAAARKQIRTAILALVAWIFLYAAIKWLIPQK